MRHDRAGQQRQDPDRHQADRLACRAGRGCGFLGDGRIEIDSNAVERLIRPIVLTKRAALFTGSEQGAEHWAIIASLLQTAVLAEVDPHRWLTDTLDKLVHGPSNLRLAELMPWNYGKPAQG